MNTKRIFLAASLIALFSLTIISCKTKKLVAKPDPAPTTQTAPPAEEKKTTEAAPVPVPEKEEAPEKPDFKFENIQFEFNSLY